MTWLLGDHLGSTSLSVSEGGMTIAEAKYTPWGKQRELAGDLPTDYGYTGQREESALGLMYYVARWYDSGIGHFVQADTVVPGAGNPAAWNRYAYTLYNPVKFVDPSGHGNGDPWCADNPSLPGCEWEEEEEGGGQLPGSGESSLSTEKMFTVSMQLDRNSPFVPDYYNDDPNDPNVGSDVFVLIDFLMKFSSLVPYENMRNDTFFIFEYLLQENQFVVNEISVLSTFEGPGNASFEGISFQTGLSQPVIYNVESFQLSPNFETISSDPFVFSADNTLTIDVSVNCRGCYNTGSGSFSMLLTERVTIPMGKCELNWGEDIGKVHFP